MKIVRLGTPRPRNPWAGYRYMCVYCHSVFELGDDDEDLVFGWRDDQRDGMSVEVDCLVCGQRRSLMDWETTTDFRDEQHDARRRAEVVP